MHSSFPRKDEMHMYRPVTRGSVQLWMTRVAKRVQGNSRFVVMLVCLVLFGLWMVWGGRGTGEVRLIESGPPVVLVVVLDRYNSEGEEIKIVDKVIENRGEYAGYGMAVYNSDDYRPSEEGEQVWSKLEALRDAMDEFPNTQWFWYLDQNAIIMNPTIPLHTHFLSPESLLALPLRDVSLFPPDQVFRTPTLRTQPVSQIGLILSHGAGYIHTGSILLRGGDYAKFVLDSWNDPLVRSYGFPGNDHQALEHLLQWHSTIIEGLTLMPKRSLLSFAGAAGDDEQYHEGDFVVHLDGYDISGNVPNDRCEDKGRSCEKEFLRYWAQRGSLTAENEQVPPKANKLVQEAAAVEQAN